MWHFIFFYNLFWGTRYLDILINLERDGEILKCFTVARKIETNKKSHLTIEKSIFHVLILSVNIKIEIPQYTRTWLDEGTTIIKVQWYEGSFRYRLGREGAFLAHTKQKVSNIVDLTVPQLAFFMGYE